MGPTKDKDAVLDERLRVRGVQGLRVADCSVMPTLHGGHTQMPAYGIGERAADFIKETWATQSQAKSNELARVDSARGTVNNGA